MNAYGLNNKRLVELVKFENCKKKKKTVVNGVFEVVKMAIGVINIIASVGIDLNNYPIGWIT